ncbi:MAG: hypothetical protein FWE27_09460 [Defluviitaleaceae bacterium]|nr:hypothetical protein [Defluviitaleaceae bacterium]
MGFLIDDALGITATLITLKEFISKKLKDDNKVFKNQLRKNITVICESAIDTFDKSPELKDIIPSYADEIIYEEVIIALENHKQLNIDEIQKKLNVDRVDILTQLLRLIDEKLQTSFEYSQRDYNAWLSQKTRDIETLLGDLKESVEQIKEMLATTFASKITIAGAKIITNNVIATQRKLPEPEKCDVSRKFYFVNSDFDLMLKAVCNDLDVIDEKVLSQAMNLIESGRSLIISGYGGEGKTTLMMRVAVEYAKKGAPAIWINLNDEDTEIKIDAIFNAVIENEQKILICLDNPFIGKAQLAKIKRKLTSIKSDIQIVLTERIQRITELFELDSNPLKGWLEDYNSLICIGNDRERKQYNDLYELKNIHFSLLSLEWKKSILNKLISLHSDVVYKSAEQLQEHKKNLADIPVSILQFFVLHGTDDFSKDTDTRLDWNEWSDRIKKWTGKEDDPDTYYHLIASFSLFGLKLNINLFCKYYDIDLGKLTRYLEINVGELKEPIRFLNNEIYPRHDVFAELFFMFRNKTDPIMPLIKVADTLDKKLLNSLISNVFTKINLLKSPIIYFRANKERNIKQYKNLLEKIMSNPAFDDDLPDNLLLVQLWLSSDECETRKVLNSLKSKLEQTKEAPLFVEYAKYSILLGKTQEAENVLHKAIDLNPKNLHPRTELGKLLAAQRGREAEAEKVLREIITIDTQNLHTRTELGKLLAKQRGREAEAEKFLCEAITIDSQNIHTRTELGKLLVKQRGREAEAEKVLREVIKIDPQNLHTRTELGKLLAKKRGREAEAEKVLLEVITIAPKDVHTRTELGRLLAKQKGREVEAEKVLREVIMIDPKDVHTRTELGRLLAKQRGREAEAEKVLREIKKIDPQNLHTRTELGKLLAKQKGKEAEAEKVLREVITIDPKDIHTRTELGKLLASQRGREAEAEKVLRDALIQHPKDIFFKIELARLLTKTKGREREAEVILNELLLKEPNNSFLVVAFSKLCLRSGKDLDKAEIMLRNIINKSGGSCNIYAMTSLSQVLIKNDSTREEAISLLEKVHESDPNNNVAKKLLESFSKLGR